MFQTHLTVKSAIAAASANLIFGDLVRLHQSLIRLLAVTVLPDRNLGSLQRVRLFTEIEVFVRPAPPSDHCSSGIVVASGQAHGLHIHAELDGIFEGQKRLKPKVFVNPVAEYNSQVSPMSFSAVFPHL